MKNIIGGKCQSLLGLLILVWSVPLLALPPAPPQERVSEPFVVGRDLNSRTWARVRQRTLPNGRVIRQTNVTVIDIATGLHHVDPELGTLRESSSTLELVGQHAVGRNAGHQVILQANLNSVPAIDLSIHGKRFQTTVLGIAIADSEKGSVMVGVVKDSIGQVTAPNQVTYFDAFSDISASLRCTYSLHGFEADVLLEQDVELPPEFEASRSRLECWTEIFGPQDFAVKDNPVKGDATVDFGSMKISDGRAFFINGNHADADSLPVRKAVAEVEGRRFLIEWIPWIDAKKQLGKLQKVDGQAAANRKKPFLMAKAGEKVTLPKRTAPKKNSEKVQMASVTPTKPAFLIDWSLISSAGALRIKANDVVQVVGTVVVTNLIIEGNSVIKSTNGAVLEVAAGGTIEMLTEPYRPAYFVGRDDTSVGQTIGTGTLSGYYADTALKLPSGNHELKHFKISNAKKGIVVNGGTVTVKHGAFVNVEKALELTSSTGRLQNVLLYAASNVVSGDAFVARGEQLTVHHCAAFAGDANANSSVYLTNSILVKQTNWGNSTFTTNMVVTNSDSGTFTTLGAGGHYLPPNSSLRKIGNTNVSILSELVGRRTTQPPIIFCENAYFTNRDATLTPQAERITSQPDLGWSYAPLDFAMTFTYATNSTITVLPGTAISFHTPGTSPYGLTIADGARLLCRGSPTNLIRLVRYSTVQEQSNTNWIGNFMPSIYTDYAEPYPAPEMNFRFTEWSMMAGETHHLWGYYYETTMSIVNITDSRFHSGQIYTDAVSFSLTNCVLNRVSTEMWELFGPSFNARLQNNLFYGGYFSQIAQDTNHFICTDNMFDGVTIDAYSDVHTAYNAYSSGSYRLTPSNATDVILSSISYDTGPLGRWYTPTNATLLIDAGSVTNAALHGMYWHAAHTNQVKEANTRLNIGLLHIALDSNGLPLDGDSDGLPSFLEDLNGSGDLQSTEADPTSTDSDGDGVSDYIEYLQGRNPRAGATTNITPNLKVYTPLK